MRCATCVKGIVRKSETLFSDWRAYDAILGIGAVLAKVDERTRPAFLTAEQRLSELAGILAAGILRLKTRAALPGDGARPGNPPDSNPACLDVPAKTVLSVLAG
jgi:hypothetical protein